MHWSIKIYFMVNPFLQYCFELIWLETEKSIKLSYSQVNNSWLFGLKTKQPIPRPKRTTLSVLNNSYRSKTAVFQLFDERLFTLFDRTKHYARISCRVSCRWRQRPTINERAWHMTVTLGVPSVLPYPGGDDTLPAALPALARSRAVITRCCYFILYYKLDQLSKPAPWLKKNAVQGIKYDPAELFPGEIFVFIKLLFRYVDFK